MKRAWTAVMVAALVTGGGVACSKNTRIGAEKAVASVLVSDEQEVALGKQVHGELTKQGARFVEDATVRSFVDTLAGKVIGQATRDRKGVKWQIFVIDDAKQVNAFVTPGGRMYVYTGLLLAAENEAEVLGVLGHEAGHVVARHTARQMVNTYGLQAVLGAALGENPGVLSQLAASVAGNGALLAFSRGDETEADEIGARYANKTGYNPQGLVTFFEKLLAQSGKTPSIMKFLSTHPASEDRIAHLNTYIKANNLSGGTLGGNELAAVQARIKSGAAAAPEVTAPATNTGSGTGSESMPPMPPAPTPPKKRK